MNTFTLPHFGQINLSASENYYDAKVEFEGKQVWLDLNTEEESLDSETIEKISTFLENLAAHDLQNKKYMAYDYKSKDGDTARFYLEHHLEECSKEELSALIDFGNKEVSPEKQLLSAVRLVRVGFYPEDEESFAIFDYSIGEKITNYLIVLNINKDGKLDYLTMES